MTRVHRLLVAVFVAAISAGCGDASDSPGPADSGKPDLHGTQVTLMDFMIMPMAIGAKAGSADFGVTNVAQTPHNFSIRSTAGTLLFHTPDLEPGESAELETTLPAGNYVTFCSLPGHESLGMKGTLIITP